MGGSTNPGTWSDPRTRDEQTRQTRNKEDGAKRGDKEDKGEKKKWGLRKLAREMLESAVEPAVEPAAQRKKNKEKSGSRMRGNETEKGGIKAGTSHGRSERETDGRPFQVNLL